MQGPRLPVQAARDFEPPDEPESENARSPQNVNPNAFSDPCHAAMRAISKNGCRGNSPRAHNAAKHIAATADAVETTSEIRATTSSTPRIEARKQVPSKISPIAIKSAATSFTSGPIKNPAARNAGPANAPAAAAGKSSARILLRPETRASARTKTAAANPA